MAGKRLLTSRLKADMITQEDVYNAQNQLIIPEGTVLTDAMIAALKERSIFAVRIQVKEDKKTPILHSELLKEQEKQEAVEIPTEQEMQEEPENLEESDVVEETRISAEQKNKFFFLSPPPKVFETEGTEQYFKKVRETREFREFHLTFTETTEALKDTLQQVVNGGEIETQKILTETEHVVATSRNSLHILDMLQCMKGYDDMTYMHCLNVAILSNMIGKISGQKLSEEDLELLTLAGLLHDIGKIMIPDEVLQKPGHLTISEYNLVKTHVFQGQNILQDKHLDDRVVDAVMRHHERLDGSGYPGGYTADRIGTFARILAIADTYDAMTSKRPYRDAICPFTVVQMFEREGITKYDVAYLLPFLNTVVQAYMNTEVQLSNGDVGKVVLINRDALSRPIVKVGETYCNLIKEPTLTIEKMLD